MQANVLFTYDEYKTLPETGPQYQLVEGDLIVTPAPNTRHQRISRNLEFLLHQYAKNTGVGEVFYAPFDVILSDTNVFQPDILFIRTKNRDRITKQGLRGVPDLVIEILSPATAEMDRGIKRKLYARYGVEELWLIDPQEDTIEIYNLLIDAQRPDKCFKDEEAIHSGILPGFKAPLSEIFPEEK